MSRMYNRRRQSSQLPVLSLGPENPEPTTPPADEEIPVPEVQNVVATANLGCRLNIMKIFSLSQNVEYKPNHFPMVIMRLRKPKTTAHIFSTGKIMCTGAKSEEDSRLAVRMCAIKIKKLGFRIKISGFKVHNVVGICDLKFPLQLELLASFDRTFVSYRPEIFPCLYFRLLVPKLTFSIFRSGKVGITGGKSAEQIHNGLNIIYPLLKRYKRSE